MDEIEEQEKYRIDATKAKMHFAITDAETASIKIKALEQTVKERNDEIADLKQLSNNELLKEVLSRLQKGSSNEFAPLLLQQALPLPIQSAVLFSAKKEN
ncbi:MAG: hypothetical protein MR571_07000 [Succinatimonas sp.]|nr:hypothetical protein [Succinatimonas sp.]